MNKNKLSLTFSLLASLFMVLFQPLQASDCCVTTPECCAPVPDCCECNSPWDINIEARVAYYHPCSKKVRHIYGDGWPDYQLEISKGFKGFDGLLNSCGCDCSESDLEWRIWAGVSGFSRKGDSIGFHDRTKLQLIPVNLGLKFFYPIFCHTKIFIGAAACYSFLTIHDHSDYVKQHTRKQNWGGLIQSGINYQFCDWGYASLFADYFFQHFNFHNRHHDYYGSNSGYVERHNLNMNGYKIGVGLGLTF